MAKPKATPARVPRHAARSPARTYASLVSDDAAPPSSSTSHKEEEEEEEDDEEEEEVAVAAPSSKKRKVKYTDVYFYVPNLVGYARVLLTLGGLYLVLRAHRTATEPSAVLRLSDDWVVGLLMYTTSFVLDFFDGYFARKLGQSSNFGAVLDMVTDRVSTMLLLVLLCFFYHEEHFEHFALLAALDYSSHWVQMYAAKGHHKTSNADKNWLVRLFYGVYPFFGFCCAGTEIFYIGMAAKRFLGDTNEYLNLALPVLFVACVCKNAVNLAQLLSGFEAVAKNDAAADK